MRSAPALCLILGSLLVSAEELPVRIYTTADGLARDDVYAIRRDSHGYLWIGTGEGLSIFDGYQFTNYTTADGLPHRAVRDILETRQGEYWIATKNGLCRFDPKPVSGKRCTPYRFTETVLGNQVNRLFQSRDGSVWAGTEGGLWRLTRGGAAFSAERVPLPSREGDVLRIARFLEDRVGRLWIDSSDGLFLMESGRTRHINLGRNGLLGNGFIHLIQDAQGRIWGAGLHGVCQIIPGLGAGTYDAARCSIGPGGSGVTGLFESTDGKLWATSMGLFEFEPDAVNGRPLFRQVAEPFRGDLLTGTISEDTDGNLWLGGAGATKLTRHGFTRFSAADGLCTPRLESLTEDRHGRQYVITSATNAKTIHAFDGTKFLPVDPYLPPGIEYGWGDAQTTFPDYEGDWWRPTLNGLLRFAAPAHLSDLARTPPIHIYRKADGLPNDMVLLLFEDSRHDVWIGVYRGLARWDRKRERIQPYGVVDGLPLVAQNPDAFGTPQYFAEDREGSIWVGFHPYGLARYRDGKFQFYSETDGLPKGEIGWIYSDHLGRLWAASAEGGVARIDDVSSQRPIFHTYTTAQGLATNSVYSVVEDLAGRIYLGGPKGVDRLDPVTGSIRHFTAADGLPFGSVQYSKRDRSGALWFGSGQGLSRYVPEPDRIAGPGTPLIRRLRVAGNAVSVSELGEENVAGLHFGAAQNNLRIEFGSLHFRSGEVLRYQYRLQGADAEWSPPADERIVTYSGLASGTYEFAVRAINGEGMTSPQVATVAFVIIPPIWRRTWAIGIELALLALLIYLAHWYRLKQILQVERIRTRLASDLHDDIGSGLAEIALLSEVAAAQPQSANEIAARLGDRARQLREGMSEIIWSVDPRQRTLADLFAKVRQSVYSMLESNGRCVEFEAPDPSAIDSIPVAPDRARQLLLICRETFTNIARHASASEVWVRMALESRVLLIEMCDNGRGFDVHSSFNGMGLRNLKRRAAEAGGELLIDSSPGKGTRVSARLPLW